MICIWVQEDKSAAKPSTSGGADNDTEKKSTDATDGRAG